MDPPAPVTSTAADIHRTTQQLIQSRHGPEGHTLLAADISDMPQDRAACTGNRDDHFVNMPGLEDPVYLG